MSVGTQKVTPWFKRPVLWIGLVVVLALAGGGIWWGATAHAKSNLNSRYAAALETLAGDTAELVTSTASLKTLTSELGEDDSSFEALFADSASLAAQAIDLGSMKMVGIEETPADMIVAVIADQAGPDVPQSGNPQSEESQSGAQATISYAVMLEELGFSHEEKSAEAQSGEEQSGASQSGVVVDKSLVFLPEVDEDVNYTKEQVTEVEDLAVSIEAQTAKVVEAGTDAVSEAFNAKLEAAITAHTEVIDALNAKIEKAEEVLKGSDKKVKDNKTRETLKAAIASAKTLVEKDTIEEVLPSAMGTEALIEETKTLDAAVKTVNDAVAAKTKADAEAKAAEAGAAAQQYNSNDYYDEYGYSGGYDNGYSGGYGSGYSGGSYSGGGSSGSSGDDFDSWYNSLDNPEYTDCWTVGNDWESSLSIGDANGNCTPR